MKETEELWKVNEDIPMGSVCTFPGATIELDVGEAKPHYIKQYKLPHSQLQIVDKWVEDMLKSKIIEAAPNDCAWNNPINVQDKKDITGVKGNEFRVCLDARWLNDKLVDPMLGDIPFIEEIHEHANGKQVHSNMDYWKCYHQFALPVKYRNCTAFTHRGRQYRYRVAPFGVKPIGFTVQKIIAQMIQDIPAAKNYVDDVIISSNTIRNHKEDLKRVLEKCNQYSLRLRKPKCNLFCGKVKAVGKIVSKGIIEIDPQHKEMIRKWPIPRNGRQVQALLGFANFVRKHIPNYAVLTKPLEKIKNLKGLKFANQWNEKHEKIFHELVHAMDQAIVLAQPDWKKPFFLAIDASQYGGGSMLYQKGVTSTMRVIGFWSKAWSEAQARYSASEREFLAARMSMDYFRTYILGTKFTLITDCKALTYINSKKDPSAMMQRYIRAMSEYQFDVMHLPGLAKVIPDTLSRRYANEQELKELRINQVGITTELPLLQKDMVGEKASEEEKTQWIQEAHSQGHFAGEAMYQKLFSKGMYWPTMRKQCKQVAKECIQCLRYNADRPRFHDLQSIKANLPMDHVAVDNFTLNRITPEGNVAIQLTVDIATGFVILRAIRDETARTAAKVLFEIFTLLGFPKVIQSDNGPSFVGSVVKEMCNIFEMEKRTISPYNPRANGVAERRVRTAKNMLLKVLNGQIDNWDVALPMVQYWMNSKIQLSTGASAFAYMFCRQPNGLKDYSKTEEGEWMNQDQMLARYYKVQSSIFPKLAVRKQHSQDKVKERWNKTKTIIDTQYFPDGSIVMVRDPARKSKCEPKYLGPFTVLRRTKGKSYVLLDHVTEELFPRDVPPDQLKLVTRQASKANSELHYQIEAVINHRGKPAEREYLLKWKNPELGTSWEPIQNFDGMATITNYWKRRNKNKSKKS